MDFTPVVGVGGIGYGPGVGLVVARGAYEGALRAGRPRKGEGAMREPVVEGS